MSKDNFIAIDPGSMQSAYVLFRGGRIAEKGIVENETLLAQIILHAMAFPTTLVVEMIASYGMAVGREVFETCLWIGRFIQCAESSSPFPAKHALVYRKDVKMYLCGSMKAKDANIRQALMDRYGGSKAVGTKKAPGPLYGFSKDMWSALAVAETFQGTMEIIRSGTA